MRFTHSVLVPFRDTYRGLESCLRRNSRTGPGWILAGLLLGWWIYVPAHELLHAFSCLALGGEVTRLEIGALYGGSLLARLLPWVTAGSEYAGQLTGFDTRGSDAVYLAVVAAPFLLSLFPGVWALRAAGDGGHGFRFGLSLAPALAPFLSLAGDAYEIGSILITRLPPWAEPALRALIRGDDLILVVGRTAASGGLRTWMGVAGSTAVGVAWAWATYGIGAWIARLLRPPGPAAGASRRTAGPFSLPPEVVD